MGQRSQIYVRYKKDGKYYLTARYYSWNYAERMISRCRHSLEWIEAMINCDEYLSTNTKRLTHILDTNFDMKDVVLGQDIAEEYRSDISWQRDYTFNEYAFMMQPNSDGKLFIDIQGTVIKYAFLNDDCNTDKIMSAARYMTWNHKDWKDSPYIDSEQKILCKENIKAISKIATLMTKTELEEFINADYMPEKDIFTDKKANAEYWDNIDNDISDAIQKVADKSGIPINPKKLEEYQTDITSEVREIVITRLQGIDGEFPYVDENF